MKPNLCLYQHAQKRISTWLEMCTHLVNQCVEVHTLFEWIGTIPTTDPSGKIPTAIPLLSQTSNQVGKVGAYQSQADNIFSN